MTAYTERIVLILAVAVPLAVLLYAVGALFADRSRVLQRLGAAMLRQKNKALATWPLDRYAAMIEAGRLTAASLLLAALILGKSLACLVLAPIAVLWLPPACMTIPPLGRAFAREKGRSGVAWRRWMANQTSLQLASHLTAAAVGASAWWGLYAGEGSPWRVMAANPAVTAVGLLASLVLAVVAGWYEASGHRRYGLV